MTQHHTGSPKCPAVRDAMLLADAYNNGLTTKGKKRIYARRPVPVEAHHRTSRRPLKGIPKHSHAVVLTDQNDAIDNLLDADAHMPASPSHGTIHDRYVAWCHAQGRKDIFNRRLARKFLKTIRKR